MFGGMVEAGASLQHLVIHGHGLPEWGNLVMGVLSRSCVHLQESEGKCVQISVLI